MTKAPRHVWIVGTLATLWNAMGGFDYTMSQTRNEAYLAGFTDPQRVYFESFPWWMEALWALGVWGGVAGSLLLLARSRFAVVAFSISLIGLAATTAYQHVIAPAPDDMRGPGMILFQAVLWAVAIGLLVYAARMRTRGVLR